MDLGALEEALSSVRRAVELYVEAEDWPGAAHTAVQEANCLIAANQPAEALAKANFALERIPAHNLRLHVLARLIIVEALVMLDRPLEALHGFEAAEPLFEDADLGTRLKIAYYGARVLDGLKRTREAEKLFRAAVKAFFEHERYREGFIALLTLFESFCSRGALEKAATLCEEAIEATSGAGPACNDLIRRAWEDLLAAVRTRQISDAELALARQFLVRNWCVPQGGALVLPRLEAAVEEQSQLLNTRHRPHHRQVISSEVVLTKLLLRPTIGS
jgi:tetratricopeptide (TPR) repeat protein